MKSIRAGALTLAVLVLVSACAQTLPQDATTDLAGTSWQLVKFQGGDDKVLTPDDKRSTRSPSAPTAV